MTRIELALALWQEQIDRGIGDPGEVVDPTALGDWWSNRILPTCVYDAAATGDPGALVRVRTEAGLPPLG